MNEKVMTTAVLPPSPSQIPAGAGAASATAPGAANRGLCTLQWQGRTFRFRTNPNEIWWSYELLTNVEDTYGGRVVQLLGTRLGDLTVKVDCGQGGWSYLMQVVLYLRDLLSDQRNGNPAIFSYTTRNWKLQVYSMTIPFADQVTATTRELELNFKIQQDLTGVLSRVTVDAELARLVDGVYPPGMPIHNQFNDALGIIGNLPQAAWLAGQLSDPQNPSGPIYPPTGIVNNVDSEPFGDASQIPGIGGLFSAIPGLSSLGGGAGLPFLGGL
jgi:hypothetical protein